MINMMDEGGDVRNRVLVQVGMFQSGLLIWKTAKGKGNKKTVYFSFENTPQT